VPIVTVALILALSALLAGCALQAKKPATPAAPAAPAPAAKPPAPPPPLSIPQTHVEIPPPQPVSEEALAAGQTPPDEPEPVAPPRPVKRSAPAANPRPEAAPAEEPARAPIQEVLSFAERKQLQDSTAEHKREIRHLVELARSRRLDSHETGVVARIEGLVKLSGDAEAKGDLREADALAQRALVLAKDLDSER
jgi:outer membrane biosynthesis protein TonB